MRAATVNPLSSIKGKVGVGERFGVVRVHGLFLSEDTLEAFKLFDKKRRTVIRISVGKDYDLSFVKYKVSDESWVETLYEMEEVRE